MVGALDSCPLGMNIHKTGQNETMGRKVQIPLDVIEKDNNRFQLFGVVPPSKSK
jgi:hypothetical protein